MFYISVRLEIKSQSLKISSYQETGEQRKVITCFTEIHTCNVRVMKISVEIGFESAHGFIFLLQSALLRLKRANNNEYKIQFE